MHPCIKIFMCTHKPYGYLPPLAVAVLGGAAHATPIEGAIPDVGRGGSISEKNAEYCELTVQYYAWKNEEADYYGFCHYRRFFGFGTKTKRPYVTCGKLTEKKGRTLLGSPEKITAFIAENGFDVITVRSEDMGVSARMQYGASPHGYTEDLDLFLKILEERLPHLVPYAKAYLDGTRQYFCNMFIMKRETFFEYCTSLFPLLEEFDRRKVLHGNFQSDRTDGYLAERFFGIYLAYLRGTRNLKIHECPRIDAESPLFKRILYHLLPPESRRRKYLKKQRIKKSESPASNKKER